MNTSQFTLHEWTTKKEMLQSYDLLCQLYDNLSFENYAALLDEIIPNNYKQIAIIDKNQVIGVSGYWIGTKIWCGKYLELDNVVVKSSYRSQGVGRQLTNYLKTKAQQEKCNMLGLDVYTDNFEAVKFYMKEGYIPRGFHMIHLLNEDYSPK